MANTKKNNQKKGRDSAARASQAKTKNIRGEVNAVILFAITVALFVCFIGQLGIVGDFINMIVYGTIGQPVAFLMLFFFIYISWNLLRGNKGKPSTRETVLFILFCVIIGAIVHTFAFKYNSDSKYFNSVAEMWNGWKQTVSGGVVCGSLSYVLQKYMTKVGAFVVLFPAGLVVAMILFSLSIKKAGEKISDAGTKAKEEIDKVKERIKSREEANAEAEAQGLVNTKDSSLADPKNSSKHKRRRDRKKNVAETLDEPIPINEDIEDDEAETAAYASDDDEDDLQYVGPLPGLNVDGQEEAIPVQDYDDDYIIPGVSEEELSKLQTTITEFNEEEKQEDDDFDVKAVASVSKPKPYKKPPISILEKGTGKPVGKSAGQRASLNENARKLEEVLASFDVSAKVINISKGPSVTRYELQPMAGVKISKIKGLAEDIALNMAATTVKIEAPIPGKAAIGIDIPNSEVDTVYLRDLLASDKFRNHKSKLAFCVGKTVSGEIIIADLAKMPHLLVGGATGAGKSVAVNCMILSFLYNATPDEVKLILIDPKQVEFAPYEDMPHLMVPVVKDARKAAGALSWAVGQMTERYSLFSDAGVRDIKGYNAYAEKNGLEKLPSIVIIIDELADLMVVAKSAVETAIVRLSQMARAAGMHLIIATQRPSVDVVTGLIKANVPSRIALKTASQVDSRTILDSAGAEKLLGRGDMIYKPGDSISGTRLQGAFVSDAEVVDTVEFLKNHNDANIPDEQTLEKFNKSCEAGGVQEQTGGAEPGEDEMLAKAIDITFGLKQISASFLQRKLSIGYNRAARLIDQMEERGIISAKDGSNPRTVLMTREQYEQSR